MLERSAPNALSAPSAPSIHHHLPYLKQSCATIDSGTALFCVYFKSFFIPLR